MTVNLSAIDQGPLPSRPQIAQLLDLDPGLAALAEQEQKPYFVGDGSSLHIMREENGVSRYVGGQRVFQPADPRSHMSFVAGGYRRSPWLKGEPAYFFTKGRSVPDPQILPLTVDVEIPKASLVAGHHRSAAVVLSVSRSKTEALSIGAAVTEGGLQGVASHGTPPTVLPLSRASGLRSLRLGGPTVSQFGRFLTQAGEVAFLDVVVPEIGPLPPRGLELWKYWLDEAFRVHLTGLNRHFKTIFSALAWGAREFRSACANPHGLGMFALVGLGGLLTFRAVYSRASSEDSCPAYS